MGVSSGDKSRAVAGGRRERQLAAEAARQIIGVAVAK